MEKRIVGGKPPIYFREFMTCQQRLQIPDAGIVLELAHPLHLGAMLAVQRVIL